MFMGAVFFRTRCRTNITVDMTQYRWQR